MSKEQTQDAEIRDTGDAEFHFTWKNEDPRKVSTSLLHPLRTLSGTPWPHPQCPGAEPPSNHRTIYKCSK